MLLKTTILSVLFGFLYPPNSFVEVDKKNIVGEWQVVKLEVFEDAPENKADKADANIIVNSTYVFAEDNTVSVAANCTGNVDLKWHLDKSKADLVMQNQVENQTDKYYLKSISNTRMVLEQHEDKHVVVSLIMEKR